MNNTSINTLINWLTTSPQEYSPVLKDSNTVTLAEKACLLNGGTLLPSLEKRCTGECIAEDGYKSKVELEASMYLDVDDNETLRWLFDGDYYGGIQSEILPEHTVIALQYLLDNPQASELPELIEA